MRTAKREMREKGSLLVNRLNGGNKLNSSATQ